MTVGASGGASDAEARQLAAAFRSLLEWVHAPEGGARNEVAALVQEVLGAAGTAESVVTDWSGGIRAGFEVAPRARPPNPRAMRAITG